MTTPAPDRVVGSLIGLAAGDCLGAGVEGLYPEEIEARHGVVMDFAYQPMVWTDDTQQALVLAEATVRFGHPDPEWVARRFVEMRDRGGGRFGLHRGTGRGFRNAVDQFALHGDWRQSGNLDRAGNGAAMRIAPVGARLAHLADDEFAGRVTDVSLVTHREPRALLGALGVAWLAARFTEEDGYPLPGDRSVALRRDLTAWLSDRVDWLAASYPEVPDPRRATELIEVLEAAFARWDEGVDGRLEAISLAATARLGRATWPTDGFVLASVAAAMVLALGGDDGFGVTLGVAVNFGGDADTVGAMVGGMIGAAAGVDAIPNRWRTFAGHDELLQWAEAFAGIRAAEGLPDLVELESRLGALIR